MCVAMEHLKAKWTAEARAEAYAEGLAEGRVAEREVHALNALRLKLSFEDVSRITGLSIEKIASLANAIGVAGEAS